MKHTLHSLTAALTLTGSLFAASEIDVAVRNLSSNNYFTPLLVTVHPSDTTMFTLGEAASASLQAMAEGGDISGLSNDFSAVDAEVSENPAGGLLAPGMQTMTTLESKQANDSLSIAAMILPTNDGFVALNGWEIPTKKGIYTLYLHAYDAGTEANDEIVNGGGTVGTPGIPADPGGKAGSGATGVAMEIEGFVHIHRGVLGDTNATGGSSDLDSRYHRWQNPIAEVIVTVK